MKTKVKINVPNNKDKLSVDDMLFKSKDGTKDLTFDEWFDSYIEDIDIIQQLKNKKNGISDNTFSTDDRE
jgi:hypothetical protein